MFGRTTDTSQNDRDTEQRPGRTAVADREGDSTTVPAAAVDTGQTSPTRYRSPIINRHRAPVLPDTRPEPVDTTEPDASIDEPVRRPGWAHVSALATFSLVVGVGAVGATLTGLLAPVGFAGGVLAVALGLIAMVGVRRPAVTGHSLVGLGVVFGLAAIALSVLAMTHQFSWLSSNTDEVARLSTWLDNHITWLRRFS